MGPLFSEEAKLVPLTAQGADATSNLECDSFHMKGWDRATIVIIPAASLTGNNVLTVECGASDSADTSDATFHYRLADAAIASATCDQYADDATASSLTLTAATYQGKVLLIELFAEELPTSGSTVYDWVTVDFDGTASVGTVTVFAILTNGRYIQHDMSSVLA